MSEIQNRAVGESSEDIFKEVVPVLNKPKKKERGNTAIHPDALERVRDLAFYERKSLFAVMTEAAFQYVSGCEKARGKEYEKRSTELALGRPFKA